jgi:hypothetical protein
VLVPSYLDSPYPVAEDVARCHQEAILAISRAGTWWTGEQRVSIAAEARAARDCALCSERKAALSPFSIDGCHDGPGELAPALVDMVHRIITDPGRLTRSWYERVVGGGPVSEGSSDSFDGYYVELVSVTVVLNALDVFARALGLESPPLPVPETGTPSRVRPDTACDQGAWVPQIPVGVEGGEDWRALYDDREFVPQIGRALSLVPAEVRVLQALSGPHYMELDHVSDPGYVTPGRTLDRMQMELIASRVSAINECFY